MAITKEFMEAVDNGNILRVRIMLKDILLVDPTGSKYDEMADYAISKLGNIYDEHDDETLNYDVTAWNEDYLNEQMVEVVSNFSKERIELLKGMVRHIYCDKAQKIRHEEAEAKDQVKHAITQKQVGVGVTVAGAALAVVGVCASQTALAIGGAAVAAVGVTLIVTDKR